MNNDELKKKIEGILQEEIEYVVVCGSSVKNVCIEHIADALIAAGIGDVKEAEHRAEVAERALKNKFKKICSTCYMEGNCRLKGFCAKEAFARCLEQAEKELAEERK